MDKKIILSFSYFNSGFIEVNVFFLLKRFNTRSQINWLYQRHVQNHQRYHKVTLLEVNIEEIKTRVMTVICLLLLFLYYEHRLY